MYRCKGKGGAVLYQDYSCDKGTKTTAAAEFTPEPVPSSTVQGERKKAGWIYCVLLSCDHLASQRSVGHSLAWNAGGARRVRVPGTRESAFSIPCWPRANRRCRHAPAAPRSVDRRSHACKAGRRSHGAPGAVRLAGGRSMSGSCKPAGQNDAKPILQLRIMLRSSKRSARSGKHGKQPKRILITSEQFRDARISSHLSREEAARFLGVSLRTIGHWETGKSRPNYAAFKLLRIFRNGDLIDPEWSGYSIIRGKLVTPENHEFAPGDLSWLSLLCRRAQAFSWLLQERDGARRPRQRPAPCGTQAGPPQSALECVSGAPAGEGLAASSWGGVAWLLSVPGPVLGAQQQPALWTVGKPTQGAKKASPHRGGVGGSYSPFLTPNLRPELAQSASSSQQHPGHQVEAVAA